jgi:hypothetical protein
MEAGEIIADARVRLDDTAGRVRWPADFLLRALNHVTREACLRANMIRDDVTSAITLIPLLPEIGEYALDTRVINVADVRLEDDGGYLTRATHDDLIRQCPRWRTHTSRVPRRYMVDRMMASRLRVTVYPKPVEQDDMDSLRLTVHRYPLEPLVADTDEPEIDPQYHLHLVHGVVAVAYEDRDPDRYDPVRAKDHWGEFARYFGERESAHVEQFRTGTYEQTTVGRRI